MPITGLRSPEATLFLGRALGDTVYAGAGGTQYRLGEGHWGHARRTRDIYGQLVRVDRWSGAHVRTLRRAFAFTGRREVVVVPWDYDAGCETTLWGRSWRWVPEGREGFYKLALRPIELWAGGRPTFDAYAADLTPYPLGLMFQHGYHGTGAVRDGTALSAREYFEVLAELPDRSEAKADTAAALRRLAEWEREHAALARRYPVSDVLRHARFDLTMRWSP